MHWKLLDLDPAQATEKEVKRAYAQRLKKCRPDQDPEGFKHLHNAYQTALGELEWRSQSDQFNGISSIPATTSEPVLDHSDDAATATSHVAVSPSVAAILDVLDRLEDSLKNNHTDVAARVRDAEVVLFQYPDEACRWGESISNLIVEHGTHADLRLKPEALLFELEHQSVAATVAVIDRLDRGENREGIHGLSTLLLNHKDRIKTPAGALAASRLACAAAFWAKKHVTPLANFAYENLARGERDFHMQHIDRHIAIDQLLSEVPPAQRCFWRLRLTGKSYQSWEDEAGVSALRWLSSSPGQRNPAFEVLRGLVPDDVANSLTFSPPPLPSDQENDSKPLSSGKGETFSWESSGTAPKSRKVVRQKQYQRSESRPIARWIVIPLAVGFMKLISIGNDTSHSPPPLRNPSSFENLKPISADDLRKRMDETLLQKDRRSSAEKHPSQESQFPTDSGTATPANPYLKLLQEPPPKQK